MDCNSRVPNEALKQLAAKEEPRFLSLIIKDKDLLVDAIDYGIKEGDDGHFWTKDARLVYWVVASYYRKYRSALTRTSLDSIVDTIKLGTRGLQEEEKTAIRVQWDKLLQTSVSSEDYEMLKDHINSRYVQWQAYEFYKKNLQETVSARNGQIELVKEAKSDFLKIEGVDPDNYTMVMDMNSGLDEVMDYITDKRDGKAVDTDRILTYIRGIDKIYNGFERGSYTVIAGLINGGKTTLMMNIGFNMAKHGHHVVYVSLEKKAMLFFTRLLSRHAEVDYNRIKRGGDGEHGLPDYFYNKLQEAKQDLQINIKPNFQCIQMPQQTTLSKIISEVNRINDENPVDVLIVDYLGVIANETNSHGRPDIDDAKTSQRLQAYGKVKNFVTITGSQLKTESSKDLRKKAKKSDEQNSLVEVNPEDLAGSKMIIADADNGIGAILNGDSPPTKMTAYSMKARDDQSRVSVSLDFDGAICKVSDPSGYEDFGGIDDIVYNTQETVESLSSSDGFTDKVIEEAMSITDVEVVSSGISQPSQLVENELNAERNESSVEVDQIDEPNDDPDDIFGGIF